jgi:hypothetical protein
MIYVSVKNGSKLLQGRVDACLVILDFDLNLQSVSIIFQGGFHAGRKSKFDDKWMSFPKKSGKMKNYTFNLICISYLCA